MKIEEFLEMMLSDEPQKSQISTLVFMDLETTGLPCDIGKRNVHITEISLIAIDRKDFETDNTFRVLNKLSLCVRPRARVSYGAMCVTGLYNDILENQEEFNDSVPKVLELFFKRLRTPICLLAHNGKKFDFPVLQAELSRLNCSLSSDILCADTLEAFRTICKNPTVSINEVSMHQDKACNRKAELSNMNFQSNINTNDETTLQSNGEKDTLLSKNTVCVKESYCTNITSTSDDEIENILLEDIESFKDLKEPDDYYKSNDNPATEKEDTFTVNLQNEFLSPTENEKTPNRTHTNPELILKNDKMGGKKRKHPCDPTYNPKFENKKGFPFKSLHTSARKNLFATADTSVAFAGAQSSDPHLNKIVHFSLEKLYRYFFGEAPPQSHYAEADCVALSKVCQRISKEFLKWIDENNTLFCETTAMW